MPLRSEPEDAAVGDVFGTLAVLVADTRMWSRSIANTSATTCATLTNSPCPIFGTAVAEHHAAVGIDVDERARLIERWPVERDAELDRHGGEALLHHRAQAIEIHDIAAPGRELDRALELVDDALDDVVIDRHAVGRDVVAADAVEVSPPDRLHRKASRRATCSMTVSIASMPCGPP